ncbi:MAG: serine/threonine-protein phosphatase [candidate division KSB1 bacterium]|nr:serine/threonine-protein phosphatase [candidate division KSB1 bacterium]
MIDAKSFYRELDALLATIRIEQPEGALLPHVIRRIETVFGERLHIGSGRLYELRGAEFVLTFPEATDRWTPHLPLDSEPIVLAAKHRSYIYDQPHLSRHFFVAEPAHDVAAIWVHSQEQQWLLVFDLLPGWGREEITLLLNAVRLSLNYRIFIDLIGGRLEQAAEIHKSLLPTQPPQISGYDVYAFSQSAEIIGGDFFDFYDFEDGAFGFSIGDATGHGIPAALLVRDVVVGLRMGLAQELRLIHTLKKLNRVIQRSTYSTSFVSVFIGEFENDGHLFYANAGHPPPVLITETSTVRLEAGGIALGFFPELKITRSHVYMPPDSILVAYTDGIIERGTAPDRFFGIERLVQTVREHKKESSRAICERIFDQVQAFDAYSPLQDDATLLIIKRLKI